MPYCLGPDKVILRGPASGTWCVRKLGRRLRVAQLSFAIVLVASGITQLLRLCTVLYCMLSESLKSPFAGWPTPFLWLEQYVCHVSKLSTRHAVRCMLSRFSPGPWQQWCHDGAMKCQLLTSGVMSYSCAFHLPSPRPPLP